MSETLISIRHLRKEYPNATPLTDLSVDIYRGDVISAIGPSGTGKSTLLRCINRLETPTSGEIWVDGVNVCDKKANLPAVRRKMGMVFQSFNLFDHLTVIENLMCAQMDLLGRSKQEAYDRGIQLLEMVGLGTRGLNYPDQMSGGQRQRVAIARTLAMDPEIILFDEPTSALDLTMMIVTHEMKFARDVSNRIFYMDEGVVYEDGTPEQVFSAPLREKTRIFTHQLKVMKEELALDALDLPALIGKPEAFAHRHFLSEKQNYRLQLCLEETLMQMLRPNLDKNQRVTFKLEYAEKEGTLHLSFAYPGGFDPLKEGDEVSLRLLRGVTSAQSVRRDGESSVLELNL